MLRSIGRFILALIKLTLILAVRIAELSLEILLGIVQSLRAMLEGK
jgi:hypothetical protein